MVFTLWLHNIAMVPYDTDNYLYRALYIAIVYIEHAYVTLSYGNVIVIHYTDV